MVCLENSQSACRRRLGQGLTRHFIGRRGGDLRDTTPDTDTPVYYTFMGAPGEVANHWRGAEWRLRSIDRDIALAMLAVFAERIWDPASAKEEAASAVTDGH